MVQVIIRSIHVVSFISMFSIDYIFVSVMVYFFVNNIILYYSFGTCVSCTRTTPPFMSSLLLEHRVLVPVICVLIYQK